MIFFCRQRLAVDLAVDQPTTYGPLANLALALLNDSTLYSQYSTNLAILDMMNALLARANLADRTFDLKDLVKDYSNTRKMLDNVFSMQPGIAEALMGVKIRSDKVWPWKVF